MSKRSLGKKLSRLSKAQMKLTGGVRQRPRQQGALALRPQERVGQEDQVDLATMEVARLGKSERVIHLVRGLPGAGAGRLALMLSQEAKELVPMKPGLTAASQVLATGRQPVVYDCFSLGMGAAEYYRLAESTDATLLVWDVYDGGVPDRVLAARTRHTEGQIAQLRSVWEDRSTFCDHLQVEVH